MEHFQDTAWVDYVRGVIPERLTAAMTAHLRTGCDRCEQSARAFGALAHLALADTEETPPEYVLHHARAIFALRRPDMVRVLPRLYGWLVFDSFRTPLPAGVRSGQPISRQVLYEAGPYWIDLRLDHERGSRRACLTGQIATAEASHRIEGLAVSLTVAGKVAAHAYTNGAGEFQLEYEPHRQVQLHIDVLPDDRIELPVLPRDDEPREPDGGRS